MLSNPCTEFFTLCMVLKKGLGCRIRPAIPLTALSTAKGLIKYRGPYAAGSLSRQSSCRPYHPAGGQMGGGIETFARIAAQHVPLISFKGNIDA